MDVVWKIDVENFPAFIVVDDKGNDFYSKWIPKTRRAGKDIL
jgi:fumarate hydratase class I